MSASTTGSRLLRPADVPPDDSPTQRLNEKFAKVQSADLPNGTDHRFPPYTPKHRRLDEVAVPAPRPEPETVPAPEAWPDLVGEGLTTEIRTAVPVPPDRSGLDTEVLRYRGGALRLPSRAPKRAWLETVRQGVLAAGLWALPRKRSQQ